MNNPITQALRAKEEYARLVRLGAIFRFNGSMALDHDIQALPIDEFSKDEMQRFRLIFNGKGYPNDGSFEAQVNVINLFDLIRRMLHTQDRVRDNDIEIPEAATIPFGYAAYANDVLRSSGTLSLFEPFVRKALNSCRTFDDIKDVLEPQFIENIKNKEYPLLIGVEAFSIYCTNYWLLPPLTDNQRFYTGVAFLEAAYNAVHRHISINGLPTQTHHTFFTNYLELLVKLLQPLVDSNFGGDSHIFGATAIQATLNSRITDLDNLR